MKKKTFDAVEFQRKVRQKLSKEYLKDPKTFMKKLQEQFRDRDQKSKAA